MRTPSNEREVVITFYTDEDTATVYTSDYSYMNRLDKLCDANPGEWKMTKETKHEGDVVGRFYSCPKRYISFRSKTRHQTEEQKEASRQRMIQRNAMANTTE